MESFEHFVCIHPYITIFIAFFIAFSIGGGMAEEEYTKKLRDKENELESVKDLLETLKSRLNL